MFLKIGVPKMLTTEAAIFRNSHFQRAPLTGCYCILLKRIEVEPPVFENIANHSADLTKDVQSRTYLKRIFILWNLEFAIVDLTRYKTLAQCSRLPYSSLISTKQDQFI